MGNNIKWPCPYSWKIGCAVPVCTFNVKTRKFTMPFDAKLPCFFCGLGSRTYSDYGPLSAHVMRDHPEIVGLLKKATFPGYEENMNVGQYNQGASGNRLPLLDAKLFRKLQDRTGHVVGKMLRGWSLTLRLEQPSTLFSPILTGGIFPVFALNSRQKKLMTG